MPAVFGVDETNTVAATNTQLFKFQKPTSMLIDETQVSLIKRGVKCNTAIILYACYIQVL